MFFKQNWHFALIEWAQSAIKLIVMSASTVSLLACTPTFNWRDVSFEQAPVTALLPCKPDRGSRQVPLAGQQLTMHMAGCEAGGAMFAVALVELKDAQQSQAVLNELQSDKKATYRKLLAHGKHIVQASVYGQPSEGRDGPGALSAQAVETFLGSLVLVGAK
jgi:hypothetical protein